MRNSFLPFALPDTDQSEIDEIAGTLVVRDLGSTHGTFVNGLEVTEAHLMPGDKLTIGLSNFLTQYKKRGTESAPPDAGEPADELTPNRPR